MRILLLGASGQVGSQLALLLPSHGRLITTTRDRSGDHQLDISDLPTLEALLDQCAPDIIVNAAAYTQVDQAEEELDLAQRINAEVPATIGAWAARHDAKVVHYSTDYVFDGTKAGAYVESDLPKPLGAYGRTKLQGDEALLASGCAALILRVSWVYGLRGRNFMVTMRKLLNERETIKVVDDQIGAPSWSGAIANTTADVMSELSDRPERWSELRGVYHLAPHGHTSWFGFAKAIRDSLQLRCEVLPIPSEDYPTPAQRPKNSRLDSRKLESTFGITLSDWQDDLQACLRSENQATTGPTE